MWQTRRSVVLLSNMNLFVFLGLYYYMLSTCLLKLTTIFFFKLTIFCRKHCIIMQIIVTTWHNVVNILRCWNICLCNLFAFVIMPQIYSEKKKMKIPLEPFPTKNLRTSHRLSNQYVKSRHFSITDKCWEHWGCEPIQGAGGMLATPENFELFMLWNAFSSVLRGQFLSKCQLNRSLDLQPLSL